MLAREGVNRIPIFPRFAYSGVLNFVCLVGRINTRIQVSLDAPAGSLRARAIAVAEGNARKVIMHSNNVNHARINVHPSFFSVTPISSYNSNGRFPEDNVGALPLSLDPLDFVLTCRGQPVDTDLSLREQDIQAGYLYYFK